MGTLVFARAPPSPASVRRLPRRPAHHVGAACSLTAFAALLAPTGSPRRPPPVRAARFLAPPRWCSVLAHSVRCARAPAGSASPTAVTRACRAARSAPALPSGPDVPPPARAGVLRTQANPEPLPTAPPGPAHTWAATQLRLRPPHTTARSAPTRAGQRKPPTHHPQRCASLARFARSHRASGSAARACWGCALTSAAPLAPPHGAPGALAGPACSRACARCAAHPIAPLRGSARPSRALPRARYAHARACASRHARSKRVVNPRPPTGRWGPWAGATSRAPTTGVTPAGTPAPHQTLPNAAPVPPLPAPPPPRRYTPASPPPAARTPPRPPLRRTPRPTPATRLTRAPQPTPIRIRTRPCHRKSARTTQNTA